MQIQEILFGLLGGLGLFVFGMKSLSESLQKIANTKIRRALRSLVGNRFKGVAVGAGITCIVQSSSVTTVMLAGLINAGIVNLSQACSVTIGANIGTTITAQIIAFKLSAYALPAIGVGMGMILFSKKKRSQFWGHFILSCGLIFLGLATMSGVMKPIKELPQVMQFFINLSGKPLLLILFGAVTTMLVQSSSASIGLLIAMASAGLIDFPTAVYLILGDNIGTTITAWLASIGGVTATRRMACFHSLFNLIGVSYFYFFVSSGWYVNFIDYITPGELSTDTVARHIANAHTMFNVINAAIFMILLDIVVRWTARIVPGQDNYVSSDVQYLQDGLLATPEVAIDSTRKELALMGSMVRKNVKMAIGGFLDRDKGMTPYVQTQESAIDHLQHDITFYITRIAAQPIAQNLSDQVPSLIHCVNDLERISDHAVNLTELTEKVIDGDFKFSPVAIEEMRAMYAKLDDMFEQAVRVIEYDDPASVERILLAEQLINGMQRDYRNSHVKRLASGGCAPLSALVFVDFVDNLEKIADHLTNIAQAAKRGFVYDNS